METPNKEDPLPMPMLTPKSQSGAQRVIKQIMVIDPAKLRMAGLDIKMAEALKKSKPKNATKSKEDKLAKAKSILNKKLKEALMKKDGKSPPISPQTLHKVQSVEEVSRKLQFSKSTKSVTPKQKIKDATLKLLMPPPSSPASSPVAANQTMEIRVLKPDKTKQSIEVKIIDSLGETSHKIDKFPKASLKNLETPLAPITNKTKVGDRESKLEENRSTLSKDLRKLDVPVESPVHGETSAIPFKNMKEKKVRKPRKGSVKQNETLLPIHSKSLPQEPESSMAEIVHSISLPIEVEDLGETTNAMLVQEEFFLLEVDESSMDMPSFTTVHDESPPEASEPSRPITTSTPERRESLPTVIESIVLSAEDKIDLSILTKKSPLIVPKKRHKHEQNWLSLTPKQDPVCINVPPVTKATPTKPESVQESAVDFINNLSNFFAASQKSKSKSKSVPEILTKECGEDATSFLMSLFEKKKDESLKAPRSNVVNKKEKEAQSILQPEEQPKEKKAISANTPCSKNDLPSPGQHSRPMVASNSSNLQTSSLQTQNLPGNKSRKENMQQIELSFVKALHESLGISSDLKSIDVSSSQTQETSVQANKFMTFDSEKDKKSIEPDSDLPKTPLSTDTDTKITDMPLNDPQETVLHGTRLPSDTVDVPTDEPLGSALKSGRTDTLKEFIEPPSDSQKTVLYEIRLPSDLVEVPTDEPLGLTSKTGKNDTLKESIDLPSELPKTVLYETPLPLDPVKVANDEPLGLASKTGRTDTLKESVPLLSAAPVSSRRKGAKPIPVLIPKLKKSRKPPTPTQKRPEEPKERLAPEKNTEKPTEESPTQPVKTAEAVKSSVPSESTTSQARETRVLCETEGLPGKNTITASQKLQRKRRDTPKSGIFEQSSASTVPSLGLKDSTAIPEELPTTSKSERPQRPRKITLKKLEEDSVPSESTPPFQARETRVLCETEELTASQKPQRKRGDTVKSGIFEESPASIISSLHSRDSAEIMTESPTTNKSGRPQRQRKITLKLLESSESFPTIRGFNSSIEKETTDSEATKVKSLHTDKSDDLIAIEIKDNATKDPIAQLLAFHETVEKFELACGLVRPIETHNATNSIGDGRQIDLERSSMTENPSCQPIVVDSCSTNCPTYVAVPCQHTEPNQQTEGKENVSWKCSLAKSTRKRKDSLKSRQFAGEDISIVYGDTLENLDITSRLQTPNTSKDTSQSRNCNSAENVNHTYLLEPLQTDELVESTTPGDEEELKIETPTEFSTKKRRGRPPKPQKSPQKVEAAVEKNVEISKPPIEVAAEKNVEISKPPIEIYKNSNLGGSWETLPSGDEQQSKLESSGSKSAKKKKGKSRLNRSKTKGSTDINEEVTQVAQDIVAVEEKKVNMDEVNQIVVDIEETVHTVSVEQVSIEENDHTSKILEDKITTEETNTPKTAKRRGRPPKTLQTQNKQKIELNPTGALIENVESIKELVQEVVTEEVSTVEVDVVEAIEVIRPIQMGLRHSKRAARSVESMFDNLDEFRTPRSRKKTSKIEEYNTNRIKAITRTSVNSDECLFNETGINSDEHQKPQSTLICVENLDTTCSDPRENSETTTGLIEAPETIPSAPCKIETHSLNVGQSNLKNTATKSKISGTEVGNDKDSPSKLSTSENDWFDHLKFPKTSSDIEASNIACSKSSIIESQINEKQSISKDDLFEELKTPKPPLKINESKQDKPLQITSDPSKLIPEIEDLFFDLDNIESPSFSPIGDSARADDSDGFEELDDDLTSSIIETVRAIEKSALDPMLAEEPTPDDTEQSASLDLPVLAESSPQDPKPKEESKPDEVMQSLPQSAIVFAKKSPEGTKIVEKPKLEEFKQNPSKNPSDLAKKSSEPSPAEVEQSSSLHLSSVLSKNSTQESKSSTEEPKPDEVKQNSSLNSDVLANKSSEDPKPSEESNSDKVYQSLSVSSSVLAEKSPEATEPKEMPVSNEESPALNSSVLANKSPEVSKSDKVKQTPEVKSSNFAKIPSEGAKLTEDPKPDEVGQYSLHAKISPDDPKPIGESISDKVEENPPICSFVLARKSPEKKEPSEISKSDELKKSSALYSYVYAKSDEKQEKLKKKEATNPFRKQVPKEQEKETDNKSETSFLGFNEEEIEEGQQSTSLRLSQSEDVESPSTSATSPKRSTKKSKTIRGKKQKQEKLDWERNSAKSLKNWLATPTISSGEDVCDIKKSKTNEQNSSIPPKKRKSRVPNSIISIHLQNDTPSTSKSVTKADLSVEEETIISCDKKEKPKRNPKLKNIPQEDLSSSIKSRSTSRRRKTGPTVDKESATDETPKRGRKLDDSDDKPKRARKSRVTKESINDDDVKEEQTENLPLSIIKRRIRKRSVSEANTPTTTATEPPPKRANLEAKIQTFLERRKKGRPSKWEGTINDPPKESNVITTLPSPPGKKYKGDVEFNPRLLLIRTKEELKSNEPLVDPLLQTEPKGPDDVQCGLCMGYASKKKWIQHIGTHYGIGWILGQPPPLNVKSRASVLNFLVEFFKASKVKGLNCRLCNSLRRSGLGLLMHLEQCCLTNEEITNSRVDCEYCKKQYSKASYLIHKRTCSEYLKQIYVEKKTECSQILEGAAQDDVLSNTGRLKRKSVIKAEEKLKNLDDTEFVPDEFIKHIPSPPKTSSLKEKWLEEISSFGKGFCANKKCEFTATTIEDLIDHNEDFICPHYVKPGYFCLKCKFHNNEIEPARNHVIKKHKPKSKDGDAEIGSSDSSDSISSGDEEVDSDSVNAEDGEKKPKLKKKSEKNRKRIRHEMKHPPTKDYRKLLPERRSNIQDIVLDEFEKFVETHYSLDPLFTYAKPNASFIEVSESYFPKATKSMKFLHHGFSGFVKSLGNSKVEPDQWKHLERLQGFSQDSEYTIYMGGPVKSIAWIPLEPHPPSNTQYLAVTVRKDIDKFTRFVNQKRSRSLIFILQFDINLPTDIKAKISYAVAIDEGPIHAIEFLPSGGYAPEMNRLGMLAVGTIETEIKIYSLPLKVEKRDCDIFPIVRLDASFELHLGLSENPSENTDMYCSQCTCLAWSKSSGHNIIFAGFLNGCLGIWDVSEDADNLNRFVVNEARRFTPISYFWTAEDRLMHFAVHYDMNGPRWLAVLNSTRKLLFYELRDITQPMLFRVEVTINIVNCLEWPIVWENVMFGFGDTMPSNGCVLSGFSPLSIMYTNRRFDKFCTGVTAMHYNVWRNSFAAGTDNGDIHVMPLREGVLDVAQRLKLDDKTISTLDIVALNGDKISRSGIQMPSDGMRVFDKEHKDQYGLVFGSIKKFNGHENPEYYNADRVPPLNLNRLMRVSQIKFNPNKNTCDVLAVGYDNGLLRVHIHDWLKKRR